MLFSANINKPPRYFGRIESPYQNNTLQFASGELAHVHANPLPVPESGCLFTQTLPVFKKHGECAIGPWFSGHQPGSTQTVVYIRESVCFSLGDGLCLDQCSENYIFHFSGAAAFTDDIRIVNAISFHC